MKCTNCNHENPDSNKFCAECGAKLEVNPSMIICPSCHSQIPVDSKFCPDCGMSIMYNNKLEVFLDQWKKTGEILKSKILIDMVFYEVLTMSIPAVVSIKFLVCKHPDNLTLTSAKPQQSDKITPMA